MLTCVNAVHVYNKTIVQGQGNHDYLVQGACAVFAVSLSNLIEYESSLWNKFVLRSFYNRNSVFNITTYIPIVIVYVIRGILMIMIIVSWAIMGNKIDHVKNKFIVHSNSN